MCNPGIQIEKTLPETTEEEWDRVIDVNLWERTAVNGERGFGRPFFGIFLSPNPYRHFSNLRNIRYRLSFSFLISFLSLRIQGYFGKHAKVSARPDAVARPIEHHATSLYARISSVQ